MGNLFQRDEGPFVERDTRKRRKKRQENKEIIIMGCGEREYPKLAAVMTTPARCYGDRQISFQGQDGGPRLLPVQRGTPGGGGRAGKTGSVFASFCCSTPLPTACSEHLRLFTVSVRHRREVTNGCAGSGQADKLLKPLT